MIKTRRSNDAGFTLIEIIAVLLILAVLAAVAIPRYLSLIDDARMKALEGALAAGFSQVSMVYAKETLTSGTTPTAEDVVAAMVDSDTHPSGDFGWGFNEATGGVEVEVWELADLSMTTNGLWTLP